VNCTQCPLGNFSTSGQSFCATCDFGRYAASEGTSTCSECAAGHVSAIKGAAACVECPPSKFQSSTGGKSCDSCSPNKFSADPGSISCQDCPRGYSSSKGSSTCSDQAFRDFFLLEGVATPCPKQADCSGGSAMPQPHVGYWVDRRSLDYVNKIYKCPRSSCKPVRDGDHATSTRNLDVDSATASSQCWLIAAYNRSGVVDDTSCTTDKLLCKPGNRGPLCSSCEQSWTYSTVERFCIECSSSHERALIIIGVGTGIMVLLISLYATGLLQKMPNFVRKSSILGTLRQIDPGAFRVLWSNYQVCCVSPVHSNARLIITLFFNQLTTDHSKH
jgi:hypothetical protein